MVVRTYFSKNNTIASNTTANTGLNPIAQLFYGGIGASNQYSRFIFDIDTTRLIDLYTGQTFTDLTKLKHTLRLTNTSSFDTSLLNGTFQGMAQASSFDLILFKIQQPWDNGVGYDYSTCDVLVGSCSFSTGPSNWMFSQTGVIWSGGSGVYSGTSSAITITSQHFDKGNENIEMDITDYVNGILTGDTNYGLGIAFSGTLEATEASCLQYVGFYTNNTQTFYEPYVETIYSNHITDDRNNFFLDKPNKLYLYVNLAGNPTNLDTLPTVQIQDNDGVVYTSYTSTAVTHVTLGVYSIDIMIPTSSNGEGTLYNDIWSGITIGGVSRPDITLNFELKDSLGYYNIGDNDGLPKEVGISIGGLKNQEKIKRGDLRKVIVSARIPYTVEQTQNISDLQYRLYVSEGANELTVVDFQPIEMANNYYYFLLDTESLIPNTYYLDVLVTSNQQTTTLKNVVQFSIVSQSDLRNSQ